MTQDGLAGINFEHSWGDGVAVLRFFQDIYAETTVKPFVHPDTKPANSNISVTRLGMYSLVLLLFVRYPFGEYLTLSLSTYQT